MTPTRRLPVGGRSHIEVYWTRGHSKAKLPPGADPTQGIVRLFGRARGEIVVAIYSLTSKPIAAALIDAHSRGVAIRGVVDGGHVTSIASKVPDLRDAGIALVPVGGNYSLMHLKVAVVDGLRTASGSFNWTAQAEKSNDEILTIVTNRKLAEVAAGQVDGILAAHSSSG